MARARLTTDYGTVVIHAAIACAFVVVAATGLRIATDDPEAGWTALLDPLLPVEHLWYRHLVAGLVLAAALLAHAIYLARARLSARVRLDRARLAALLRPGSGRLSTLGVIALWVLVGSLWIEIATGVMLFAGSDRTALDIHLSASFIALAAVGAHVALHAASGGLTQLARIVRPAPLVVAPPPPDLAELLADELARRSATASADGTPGTADAAEPTGDSNPDHQRQSRRDDRTAPVLHANPFATAVAVAVAVGALAVGVEQSTRSTLRVVGIGTNEAPVLDGDISDPVWARTTPVSVLTTQGGDFGGSHQSLVEVRALHNGVLAYFAFVWEDPTRSLKHLPLVKRAGRWYVTASRDDLGDETRYNEDKLAVLLTGPGLPLIGGAIHLARLPLADKPPSSTGRGLHFTIGDGIADVWQWRASHGGPAGHIDNCHFGSPTASDAAAHDEVFQYSGGFALDPGEAGYVTNVTEVRDGGRIWLQPRRLPRNLPAMQTAIGRLSNAYGESESEGARWWMTMAETVPWSAELDATVPDGTVLPSVLVPDRLEATATSIRGVARWAAGRWTLELVRRLYTGSPTDVPIKSGAMMWVAAFDHAEKRHTRHLRPFILEVD